MSAIAPGSPKTPQIANDMTFTDMSVLPIIQLYANILIMPTPDLNINLKTVRKNDGRTNADMYKNSRAPAIIHAI